MADGKKPFLVNISLLDLLIYLATRKWLIIRNTLIALVVAFIYARQLPPEYTVEVRAFAPQQFGQLVGRQDDMVFKNPTSPNELYINILRSRTLVDNLVTRVFAKKPAKIEFWKTRLIAATTLMATPEGIISIIITGKDPQDITELANGYVFELQRFTSTLAVTDAARRRLFFERQMTEIKEQLVKAETYLRQTQRESVFFGEEQGHFTFDLTTDLRRQIAQKELQLSIMSRLYATELHPAYQRLKEEIAGMQRQLSDVEKNSTDTRVLLPAEKLAAVRLEYQRKLRQIKYYETVLDMMARQYEIAKIDEAREAALIQILDKAVVPTIPSGPNRIKVINVITLGSLLLSMGWLIIGYVQQHSGRSASTDAKLAQLKAELRPSLPKRRTWRTYKRYWQWRTARFSARQKHHQDHK